MKLLDGRRVKKQLLGELKTKLKRINRNLGFCIIQIGDDNSNDIYLRNIVKMSEELNYYTKIIKYDNNVSEETILSLIRKLNKDDLIDGILLLKPISQHLNLDKIQNSISFFKDIDGATDINMGKLVHGANCLVSATAMGVFDLLKYYDINVNGKNVVIIGRSNLVGKPLASLLVNNDATVTICHSKTYDLKKITRQADIVIVAAGIPNFINKDYLKENSIVIDVGINKTSDGIVGDVCFDEVADTVKFITPVPGGVGQVTIAEVCYNVYKAYINNSFILKE